MSELSPTSGELIPVHPASSERCAKESVSELVRGLLSKLAGMGPVRGPKGMRPSIRRYTDKQFHYLEVSMPGLEGVEADICIHDGCIYVRTAR